MFECQYVVENPLSGGLWNLHRLSTLLRKDFIGVFDMCRFGTSYRKPTKLCGSCPWIERFNLRCNCSLCHEHLCGLTRCSVPVMFSRNCAVLNGFGLIEFQVFSLKGFQLPVWSPTRRAVCQTCRVSGTVANAAEPRLVQGSFESDWRWSP